jgi:PAS domain S-box-containing protein
LTLTTPKPDSRPAAPIAPAAADLPVPMALLDREMRFRWMNAAAAHGMGKTVGELLGTSWYDWAPDARGRRAEHQALFARTLEQLDIDDIRVDLGAGRIRHYRGKLRPVVGGDGKVAHILAIAEDITERRAAAATPRSAGHEALAIEAHTREYVLLLDAGGTILSASPSLERVTGYKTEERVGRSALEHCHPDFKEAARERFVRLQTAAGSFASEPFEVQIRHRNGEWRWMELVGNNLLADPAVNALVVVGRDITDHKLIEEEIRTARANLEAVLERVQVGLWSLDLATHHLMIDENAARIAGSGDASRILSLEGWQQSVHADDRAQAFAWLERCKSGFGAWHEVEYRHLRRDGTYCWILLRGHRATPADGRAAATVEGVLVDISDRKTAELALRQSEERYRTLARLVNGYVFEARFLPDGGFEATWADDGLAAVFGCERAEVNRRGWLSFIDPRDRGATEKRLAAIAAGATLGTELRITAATGKSGWLRVVAEPARDPLSGAITGLIGMIEDITERKALTDQMLEAVNREQRRIGSDLHDGLGQVLTGVSLLLRGAHNRLVRGETLTQADIEPVIDLVAGAIESTRSLAHGLSPGTLDAGGLMSALEDLARRARGWSGLEIGFQSALAAPLPLDVTTSDHLYRIVQEAITNAARHARARRVGIVISATEGELAIAVTDDGVGLPEAPARGLGLRTMQYRAETIGADLSIGKVAPCGTQVRVRLPLPSALASA